MSELEPDCAGRLRSPKSKSLPPPKCGGFGMAVGEKAGPPAARASGRQPRDDCRRPRARVCSRARLKPAATKCESRREKPQVQRADLSYRVARLRDVAKIDKRGGLRPEVR